MGSLVLKKHFVIKSRKNGRAYFMRMLLAFDQSRDSKGVIRLLQKLNWPPGSTLVLLHVITLDDEMTKASSSRLPKKKLGDSGKPPL